MPRDYKYDVDALWASDPALHTESSPPGGCDPSLAEAVGFCSDVRFDFCVSAYAKCVHYWKAVQLSRSAQGRKSPSPVDLTAG